MLKSVYFSISTDLTKPDLSSLCFDLNKNGSKKLNLVSTDRVRLSCVSTDINLEDTKRFVVPRVSIAEIIKFEPTVMLINKDTDNKLYFKSENNFGILYFSTVLTNSEYPDIYAYLTNPFDEAKKISLDKSEFIKALKRIRLTRGENKEGTLDLSENKVIVSTTDSRNKAKECIKATTESLGNFSFNVDYVLEYLNQEIDSKIDFKLLENKCIIFDKPSYRHVLSIN